MTRTGNEALRLAAGAGMTLLIIGCQDKLPSGPSELTTGITVYEHANFEGRSAHLVADVSDLEDYSGPCAHTHTTQSGSGAPFTTTTYDWNDCISSVRVAPGWRATIYGDDGFHGGSMELTTDVPDLKRVNGSCSEGFNDCVSSVRVQRQ